MQADDIVLLPDSGPLITLAYANSLDVLLKPGWRIEVVDMVLHELTRNTTPTSEKISAWIAQNQITIVATRTFAQHLATIPTHPIPLRKKANLGELAIQESINQLALLQPNTVTVLLFEDQRIARTSFFLPIHCQKISTRAFLIFLEEKKLIASAIEIERKAIHAGRLFSQLVHPQL